ncbi:uncharacterized protein ACN427_005694 isoform 1-T4 [Glossina fuscipes fuscipes]
MYKKFVPLNSVQSPSRNPYEVRTYLGEPIRPTTPEWKTDTCGYDRDCNLPPNSTIAKVLTLEDEIKRIHRRARENRFSAYKRKCELESSFVECVLPQLTPAERRRHAVAREKYLKVKSDMNEYVHDLYDMYSDHPSLVKLESPVGSEQEEEEGGDGEKGQEEGDDEKKEQKPIKPLLATPECSMDLIFIPPQKMLELKRPKSGIYINETEPPNALPSDEIPYSTYNPRVLQEQFDAQNLKRIDLIDGPQADLWTWNLGIQEKEEVLDKTFIDAAIAKFDCSNAELVVFKIPTDLDKTFSAGIVFGNKAIKSAESPLKPEFYYRPKEMACLYVAFVEAFRLNADFWNAETMDLIIDMGEKLVEKSKKMFYKSADLPFDIIPEITERDALISLKIHFTGPLKSQPNIYKALSLYFSKYNAGILCSKKLYLLIWKRCKNFYYIYDPNGRTENCERDFENGKCALMSTHFIEHLVHLIVNISQTNMDDEFSLYGIILENYGKISDPLPATPFKKLTRKQWATINEAYALIPSCNYGLTQPNIMPEPNPSMLIAVMALLYNYIERPNTWDTNSVDQIIRIGTAYYKSLRRSMKMKEKDHVNILDVPDKYVLGQYKASMKKKPFFYTGTVTDYCKKFVDSLLACGLKELFSSEWEAALIQIDSSVVAVWRDKELYYLFDPFKRGRSGQVIDPDDYKTDGAACLQMHANFDSLLWLLCQNALKMRRGGKFFIHAVKVGCIKPILDGKYRKMRYTGLKLMPDVINRDAGGEDINAAGGDKVGKKKKDQKKGKKGKDKKVQKVCSIVTVPDNDRLPGFENIDIVDGVLEDFLCELLRNLPEEDYARPRLYKSANRVLLRSDKEYLESLKYMVTHDQDFDNYNAAFPTQRDQDTPILTLEDELAIPSNFQNLPDGTWIIFGNQTLPRVDDEQTKLKGLLSALVTAALVAKYKISTWTSELVDYSMQAVDSFGEEFQVYQYALGAFLSKKLPRVTIGQRTYDIRVHKTIKSNIQKSLRQVLLESLINYNRMVVICQRFCCLIVKRYNFLYMFVGFPVNAVGYRKNNAGPACLLRFVELDSLIRRIEYGCNPQGCDITHYVVVTLKVIDSTPEPFGRYRAWPSDQQESLYKTELDYYKKAEMGKLAKMQFLDSELSKENARIKEFLDAKAEYREDRKAKRKAVRKDKAKPVPPPTDESQLDEETREEGGQDEEGQEETAAEEDPCDIKPKHKFGTKIPKSKDEFVRPRPVVYGYRLREKDYLYKIQGSKALSNRSECLLDKIKPCFFASTMAILYTILRPLNEWTSQRIDQLIDSATILTETLEDMSTTYERALKNVSVDEYTFNVMIRVFEPMGMGINLRKQLERATTLRKYLMLHTANCTYAIFRDEYYHLFDPYPSMETTSQDTEKGEEGTTDASKQKMPKLPKGTKKFGERNTASWLLFADIQSMLQYMDKRSCSPTWKEDYEYTFHVMDIISYKKSPQNTHVLTLLTSMAPCQTNDVEENARCAHNESIAWLEHCLPVWSRLNRRNAAGRYRSMGISKFKKYDIEIEARLWSLWGTLHPSAPVFELSNRGKQFLACSVVALCAARLYRLIDWSPQLLDSIVINGNRYHQQSLGEIKCEDYNFSIEDLNLECWLDNLRFVVHIEHVVYGKLYTRPYYNRMNLAEGLMYFFTYFQFGILQCLNKCLAIGYIPGHDGGYFMFDCQSRDHPIFPKGQGASYVLRTKHLQVLLYCIVVTLNVPYYNVLFTIHKVEMLAEGASVDEDKTKEGTAEPTEEI